MNGPTSIFAINLHHGIWRATLDGRFFGDYRSKAQALDGVTEARLALGEVGRLARVVTSDDEH